MPRKRGRLYPRTFARVQRSLANLHVRAYRASGGRIGGSFRGSPIFVLLTTGRKTGAERRTPLLYMPHGDDLVIIASNGSTASSPAWWLNLEANPRAEAILGNRRIPVTASETSGEERRKLWESVVEMYPGYAGYQRKTDREIPVIRLKPEQR